MDGTTNAYIHTYIPSIHTPRATTGCYYIVVTYDLTITQKMVRFFQLAHPLNNSTTVSTRQYYSSAVMNVMEDKQLA